MAGRKPELDIVLIGGGGHAKVVSEAIFLEGTYSVRGFLDRNKSSGDILCAFGEHQVECLGSDEDESLLELATSVVICIGDNLTRRKIHQKLSKSHPHISYPTILHPTAVVSAGTQIGRGTVVLAGVVINMCAEVGDFCVINTSSSIDHDSLIRDYSFIGPGATLCGNVKIGEESFVGAGSVVLQGMEVGEKTLIGAATLIIRSVGAFQVIFGVPGRVQRSRSSSERYI